MKRVFNIRPCVLEIIEILEKYKLSIFMMDQVLESVKKDVHERTMVHTEEFE